MHNLIIKQLSDNEAPPILTCCMISGYFTNLHCISQLTKLILTFINSIFILIYFIEKKEYIIFHSDLQVSTMHEHLIELCHSIAYTAS